MRNFKEFASYYDLIYRDKDYKAEVEFVLKTLGSPLAERTRILDLGCGTGKHALELASLGFDVLGIDISKDMIALANQRKEQSAIGRKISFAHGDITSFRHESPFDVVVSLFHVMSYQSSQKQIKAAFETVKHNLKKGGKFLFDFWYGPGVLSDPPQIRYRTFSGELMEVNRVAVPEIHYGENIVDVDYHLFIRKGEDFLVEEEKHRMRYFFVPELMQFASDAGLSVLKWSEWRREESNDGAFWNGYMVCQL